MRKMTMMIGVAAALLAAPVEARDLVVVGFGGGFQDNARKHLYQAYQKASGQAVKDEVYNGEMAKIYAMVKAKDVTWDVVMVEAPELVRGCEDGVLAKIDWSVVDKSKFLPNTTSPCGAGAVAWGATIFYDTNKIKDGPRSYADFWNLRKWPGKRSLRSGPKMTLEIALLADGVQPQQVYPLLATPAGVERAFRKLDEIKPHIAWWRSGAQPLQFVGSGEVAMATGYTGRIAKAREDGAAYPLVWDSLLWSVDFWTVVKGSPLEKEGMKMIEWITGFEPLRAMAESWPISPANKTFAEVKEIRDKNPAMLTNNIENALFINTEFWIEHGEDLEKRFASWASR